MMKNNEAKRLVDKRRGIQKKMDRIMKTIESSDAETPYQHLTESEREGAVLGRAIAVNKHGLKGITKENRGRNCKELKAYLADVDGMEVSDFLQKILGEVLVTNGVGGSIRNFCIYS